CGEGKSWEACSKGGTVKGFNVRLKVDVQYLANNHQNNCASIECTYEKCPAAYLWPYDDIKTRNCNLDESFVATWC
ncbi:hypothetical protein DYB38_013575, partial [Aphanomyces astaci]